MELLGFTQVINADRLYKNATENRLCCYHALCIKLRLVSVSKSFFFANSLRMYNNDIQLVCMHIMKNRVFFFIYLFIYLFFVFIFTTAFASYR